MQQVNQDDPHANRRGGAASARGIAAIVVTQDEAEIIAGCLRRLTWVDELVVVDSGSTDGTPEICRRFTPLVFHEPWRGFCGQKEFAVAKTSQPWILWVDADEFVPPELAAEIRAAVRSGTHDGYLIPRVHMFLGRPLRHVGLDAPLRLFRADRGRFRGGAVHEGVEVSGSVGRLQHLIQHWCTRTLAHRIAKLNQYTSLDAADSPPPTPGFVWRELFFRPLRHFFLVYVQRRAFLDGVVGYLWSVYITTELFFARAKQWERYQPEEPRQRWRETVQGA